MLVHHAMRKGSVKAMRVAGDTGRIGRNTSLDVCAMNCWPVSGKTFGILKDELRRVSGAEVYWSYKI